MIFVALGTQKFQMNRLIKAVDEIAGQISEEIFVQRGNSDYTPSHCKYEDFLDAEAYDMKISECSLLISHGGVGTIIAGINYHKPVIVVPRRNKYAEHVDDHQRQIAEAFASKGCVLYCDEIEELKGLIDKAKTFDFQPYKRSEDSIEETIMNFIDLFD